MAVDATIVRRIARLARIEVPDAELAGLAGELNGILGFVAQLEEVDITGIEPMTSVMPMALRMREDRVSDGGMAEKVLANAPQSEDGYFLVPKVVE